MFAHIHEIICMTYMDKNLSMQRLTHLAKNIAGKVHSRDGSMQQQQHRRVMQTDKEQ